MIIKSGIYQLRNRVNEKRYIGSAKNLAARKAMHLYQLRLNEHGNQHLQRAYTKHGEAAFVWEVIERCSLEQLVEREQHYIDACPAWLRYNIRPLAHSNIGLKHPPEFGHAISRRLTGHKKSPETLEKMRLASTGRPKTEAERAKLSAAHKGKVKTPEHIEKVAAKRRGSKHSEETLQRYRNTRKGRLFLTPEAIEARSKCYPALVAPDGTIHPAGFRRAEFCRQHGLLESGFNKMCRGETKTHRGWALHY